MKPAIQTVTLKEFAEQHNTTYGANTCIDGVNAYTDTNRLQTGIFTLDLATGGGLPIGMITSFKGPESGGKSSAAMNTAAIAGKICWRCFKINCTCSEPPIRSKVFWADIEGTFNVEWATAIGMDPETYLLGYGEDGEQYVDLCETAIRASDCGLVVIDSVSALTPSKIIEGSAYNNYMGVDPRFITPFIKRLRSRLIRERKLGHPVVCLLTNQIRFKIGEMFGNPETVGGGQGLKHEIALSVRFSKRSPTEAQKKMKDESRDMDRLQRHSFSIDKLKLTTYAGAGEFVRAKENISKDGVLLYKKGDVLDAKSVIKYGKDFGLLVEEGGKYRAGVFTGTQKEIIEAWRSDRGAYLEFQKEVTSKALQSIDICQ